jgi:hypothetical protein
MSRVFLKFLNFAKNKGILKILSFGVYCSFIATLLQSCCKAIANDKSAFSKADVIIRPRLGAKTRMKINVNKMRLIASVVFVLTTPMSILLHDTWQCQVALISAVCLLLGKKIGKIW